VVVVVVVTVVGVVVVGGAVVGGRVAPVVDVSASPLSLSEQAASVAATVLARNPRRVSRG
jgi:hypothetical protein